MSPRAQRMVGVLLAALVLNFALSFNSHWPTLLPVPDARLSAELVAMWVVMLAAAHARGAVPARLVAVLAAVFTALVIGRYADVTVAMVMGREINLYWDGAQLPRFVWVTANERGWWLLAVILAAAALAIWVLYRGLRLLLARLARDAVPRALRSPVALAVTAIAALLAVLNAAGQQWTWPLVSKPVMSSVLRQAGLLRDAWSPERLARALPASPRLESDLATLGGRDVQVIFLESYGAVAFERAAVRDALPAAREALARGIAESGRGVVSAYVRSPTFGGASDLAHLSLLSGIDLADPRRHDLLLMSDRPTLLSFFRARGYETFGVYPALSWEWPEGAFYGYEHLIDGPGLGYRGPAFGYWKVPDQYAMAKLEAMHPVAADSRPRFTVFATMNTHAPFRPVPPYQPDRGRLLSEQPFDPVEADRAIAEGTGWHDLTPAYVRSLDYMFRWLGDHLARPRARDAVFVLIGDHQPLGPVSGPGATWNVPVHIVADAVVLDRLAAHGFRPGLSPRGPEIGGMHELATMLLDAFDGRVPASARIGGTQAVAAESAR